MITVIIPTYNRPECLKKVFASYTTSDSVSEIIIINDSSSVSYDETENFINSHSRGKNIQIFKNSDHRGQAFCKQYGVEKSKNNYIFFGEDDAFLSANYIDSLFSIIQQQSNACVVAGKIVYLDRLFKPIHNERPVYNKNAIIGNFTNVQQFGEYEICHALALWNKEKTFFRGVRYFDKFFYNGYREETDVLFQIHKKSLGAVYITPKALCFHYSAFHIDGTGRHQRNKFLYELFTVINNSIFIFRHASYFLKTRGIMFFIIHPFLFFADKCSRLLSKIIKKESR